jgi:hypothetical protein
MFSGLDQGGEETEASFQPAIADLEQGHAAIF